MPQGVRNFILDAMRNLIFVMVSIDEHVRIPSLCAVNPLIDDHGAWMGPGSFNKSRFASAISTGCGRSLQRQRASVDGRKEKHHR